MPIARINGDGSIHIYNSKTGEEKDVKPNELGKFNPNMISQYQTLVNEQQKTQKSTSEKNTTAALTQLETILKDVDPTTGDAKHIAWRFNKDMEKTAKKRGVDMAPLWAHYNSLTSPQEQQQSSMFPSLIGAAKGAIGRLGRSANE